MISRKLILKIILFLALIIFLLNEFKNNVNENNNELDLIGVDYNSNLIADEITPYCNGYNYSLSEYSFADIEKLNVEIKNSRKWYKNLVEVYSSETDNVFDPNLKKRFDAVVTVKFLNNHECSFNARVRLSGDLIDHIEFGHQLKASLDVNLDDGNILGITKFKLFLEDTRGSDKGKNEVLNSAILRHLGFIAPRTAIVPVTVNNSIISNYIFQEKASKEMIEYHGYREGPIMESNEKYLFDFQEFSRKVFDQDRKLFLPAKLINDNWHKSNIENLKIGTEALQLYNKSIFSSYDSSNQLNYKALNIDTLNLYIFDMLNFALNAKHGIINHNRKFYYDKIFETFIPIYYDGNSQFLSQPEVDIWTNYKKTNELTIAANYFLKNNQLNINVLAEELNYFGLNYDIEELSVIIENLINNIKDISELNELEHPNLSISDNLLNAEDHNVDFIFLDNLNYKICNQKLTFCSDSKVAENLSEIIDLTGKPDTLIFGNSIENALTNIERSEFISTREIFELDKDINLHSFNDTEITINKKYKTLNIFINKSNQKVLISGEGVLKNWIINIDSSVTEPLEYRQDSLLLTGCLTFYNINIINLSIYSKNQHCEDAVNFLRTNGNIQFLKIENSMNDGLDADYSTIEFLEIEISKTGNDCADLSGGNYILKNVYLVECSDKAISIGEKSKVTISSLSVSKSDIAIAVKDSSKTVVGNLYTQNNKICIAIYRKKQEFGPSYASIENNNCELNSINYIQAGSYYDE